MKRLVLALVLALAFPSAAAAAPDDPLLVYTPEPPVSPPPPPIPPNGYFNGPCGLAVDSSARVYVADQYHDVVDVFSADFDFISQLGGVEGPCGLAVDGGGNLYVNGFHRQVTRFGPQPLFSSPTVIDSLTPTGVAADPVAGRIYVNDRTSVSVYDASGKPLLDGGEPVRLGAGSLEAGYGVAVSRFSGTAGWVYVADAGDDTVKVFDPAVDPDTPVGTLAPPGGFSSLRDSSLAVDRVSGEIYVVDRRPGPHGEQPRALVEVFGPDGTHLGHLKYETVDGEPTGIAVDNSPAITQGRVYVTSGNNHRSGIYVYPPGAASGGTPLAPSIPPLPPGGDSLFPAVSIGGSASGGSGIACEGDACQILPSEPTDPTLTTLLTGPGNPKVRYRRAARGCRRTDKGSKRREARIRHRQRCRRAQKGGGRAAASSASGAETAMQAPEPVASPAVRAEAAVSAAGLRALALEPPSTGVDVAVRGSEGSPASAAGSHPYQVELGLGLEQGGGDADLRDLRIQLPPGLLLNPASISLLCSSAQFGTPRSSPFESSLSGENCPDRTQVGTVEVTTAAAGGETRRFGLFQLAPPNGAAVRLAAAPFGTPLVFDGAIGAAGDGAYAVTLAATEVPQALQLRGLKLTLWGVPWDASHNGERGDCLDEAEPEFPWARCSVGEPINVKPVALLTLPTECGVALSFVARWRSHQQAGESSATAVNRDDADQPALVDGCESLGFDPRSDALLTVRKASSSSGFVFRLQNEDPGLADPRVRIRSLVRRAKVELPRGVTLNPSLGAGLGVCRPDHYGSESALSPAGAGCPNAAKIGVFSLRTPFYEGFLKGSVYLAQPDDPDTTQPGAENPFDSLVALYLVAKSADRGLLVKTAGEVELDPGDGTLTAVFDDLPQLPYSDLEVNLKSGQRAPLVSPSGCGAATARISMTPWAGPTSTVVATIASPIDSGIEGGPCPDGSTAPFSPGAVAGGVNSNVGSYTPYFVRLTRRDSEQEITSYSLVLPRGITGKLAGIPFCPDAAIEAARTRQGADELADPSCPAASRVGRTLTGYGVGNALTYADGGIYLAGPYHGSPLSLVTVNAAKVGPFDLGTTVVRSAFDLDQRTAQLQIDSRASDPIPHILDGVPLHLRDIRVFVDRPQFTHNPTSCEASQLVSTLTGSGASLSDRSDDSTATVQKHFQLLNCLTLGFRPHLGLSLEGGTRRGDYPGLKTVFRARPGDAGLDRIAVTMPRALFFAQEHIRGICTQPQFEAERCPPDSVYGRAAARSPLFDEPLRGKVYLRSNPNHPLPDLAASLRSGSIRIVLEGQIGPSKRGGIRAFFEDLPDAPIDRFAMWLRGGSHGLLVNSVNVCASPPQASVKALGQNNRGAIFTTRLRGRCGKDGSSGGKGR